MSTVYADSVEYVRVLVKATRSGVDYDPTGDAVYFAFLPEGVDEESADWVVGDWETVNDKYYARCLRGSSVVLQDGRYEVLVKVLASPETIIRNTGALLVI